MRLKNLCAAVLLSFASSVCVAGDTVVPTTTLATLTTNNTSAANSFTAQGNGNAGAGNISKVNVHSLLYTGANTKVYAHLMLWFGGSNHMNVGYSSTDPAQIHNQITDMISRGIDGVIIDWYGPNNSIDQATQLVMAEAETHPGFTFAIMADQGAIQWDSCSGCSPQQALISQLQYVEQTYFPSPAYMTSQGRPVISSFGIDDSYTIDWNAVNAALSTQPIYLFQNNGGFTHVMSGGAFSWVMPTTSDYGMSYLTSFYDTGIPLTTQQTVGASYKGFNDTLASWGSNRIMGQQCGQTWLQTFSEINGLYNSGQQLSSLQLVTWNDYEEGSEIESGIGNCLSLTASVSGNSLQWVVNGDESTVDHYVAYISLDGQNLMPLGDVNPGTGSVNLCGYSFPNGTYISYVQAVGKPSIANQISGAVQFALSCTATSPTNPGSPSNPGSPGSPNLSLGTNPSSVTMSSGGSGNLNVTVAALSGSFNSPISLACSGLPANLSCSFAPVAVTPGAGSTTSVLTIASVPAVASYGSKESRGFLASCLLSFGLLGIAVIGKIERRRLLCIIGTCVVAAMVMSTVACGGNAASPVNASSSTPKSYVVTVSGSATSVQLSTTVTVTVN